MASQTSGQGGRDDMERLLDLFLNQEVELPYTGGLESDIVSDDDETVECADSVGMHRLSHDDIRIHNIGRKLADCGDQFLNSRNQRTAETEIEDLKRQMEAGADTETAYSKFKHMMEATTEGTPEKDATRVLGAVLLTLHGLHLVSQGAKGLAKSFTRRFMHEARLDQDIQRGLEKLQQEVD